MRKQTIITACSILILVPLLAWGHGSGQSFEQISGDYLVDLGIDTFTLEAQAPMRIDFILWNKDRTETIPFDTLWIRIAPKDKGITFVSTLALPEFGSAGMTFTFPKEDAYELTARFQKKEGGEPIAETVFPLTIEASKNAKTPSNATPLIGAFLGGIVLGFIIAWFIKK